MDYAIGSVAALISGNVTPNRPRLIKKALTPTKHQASPNVTPKSEYVDDRSIFLSPSLQRKKAIVKKSPKRIFQNPDLEVTNDGEGSSVLLSPKADKVKKHLKGDLDADESNVNTKSPKSPKKAKVVQSISTKNSISENEDQNISTEVKNVNESTPKKKKKQRNSTKKPVEDEKENLVDNTKPTVENNTISKKRKSSTSEASNELSLNNEELRPPKKKRKNKKSKTQETVINSIQQANTDENKKVGKKKKNKKGKKKNNIISVNNEIQMQNETQITNQQSLKKKIKTSINPNAITNKDSDSEHESDDEIESENEQTNKEVLNTGSANSSEDEEEENTKKENKKEMREMTLTDTVEQARRTIFVGNLVFSQKYKKEIKKIFRKYGPIETIRIRTIPVKDARVTPKMAVIKNQLHPDRNTVNAYVRFKNEDSVEKALAENNSIHQDNHLRVTRSDITGTEHDPHKAIFIGNMPFTVEDDVLRAKFEKCGEIESVRIVRDSKTNFGKGFGYINFASKDGVELALAMSEEDLTIKNRILRIKRCTLTNKNVRGKEGNTGRFQGNQRSQSQGMMRRNQQETSGNQEGRTPGNFGRNQSLDRNQGNFGRNQGNFDRNQGNFGRNQGNFGRNQGNFDRNQGNFGRNQGNFGRNQGNFGRNQGGFGRNQGSFQENRFQGQDGAYRRLMKKNHDEAGGSNISQPSKEKKPRKEFVGMTAEKKKKLKFNKGDKKNKALSEILTKRS